MILSDTQMTAVRHGDGFKPDFQWVDLPVGRQPLPGWAKGFHVDFMEKYANSPDYRIKADRNLRDWPDKVFRKEGSRYMAVTDDGRAEVYYHGGDVSEVEIQMFRSADGTLRQYRRSGPEYGGYQFSCEPGEWEQVVKRATTLENGFGGAAIFLKMDDGEDLVLRGPWHGGAPDGYVEAAYHNRSEPLYRYQHKQPWFRRSATGGLFITEDLFMRLLARFAPECRCARVSLNIGERMQAVRGDWDVPKPFLRGRR